MANEMRDRLVELLNVAVGDSNITDNEVKIVADYLLTNDVVPVVRCKDCKWLYKPSLLCTHKRNRVFNTGIKRDFNCYCNYGEKEDEGNEKDSTINTVFE